MSNRAKATKDYPQAKFRQAEKFPGWKTPLVSIMLTKRVGIILTKSDEDSDKCPK